VDSLLIVSEPFAVAYGLDALLHTMIIDIGAGTTDFCVMKGRYPTEEDQRTLTVAGDSIDTQLLKLVQERYPAANITVFMVREWKEQHSFVGNAVHVLHEVNAQLIGLARANGSDRTIGTTVVGIAVEGRPGKVAMPGQES